jgi:hypothetical protein
MERVEQSVRPSKEDLKSGGGASCATPVVLGVCPVQSDLTARQEPQARSEAQLRIAGTRSRPTTVHYPHEQDPRRG